MTHPALSRHRGYLAAISALLAIALALSAVAYSFTQAEQDELAREAAGATTMRDLGAGLFGAINDEEVVIHLSLASGAQSVLDDFAIAVRAERTAADSFRSAAADAPAVVGAIDGLVSAMATWRSTFAEPAMTAIQEVRSPEPFAHAAAAWHESIDAALAPVQVALDDLDRTLERRREDVATTRAAAMIAGLATMVLASGVALGLVRRYGGALERTAMQAGILNRFTEVTSFASDDTAIAASNLEALALLTHPDASVTHVLNRTMELAVPEAISGEAIAEVLPLGSLALCAGLVRGSMHVTNDAAAPLSVHCPVYPVDHGTLACVPLATTETVGAVHLYWARPNALPADLRPSVAQIAEHAALGISNRRLLATLQGQASTDQRTGLANTRAFDEALDDALRLRPTDQHLSVLMLDIDHFKEFNDRHGHPAGDEALRTFAGVLRSCMREGDVAARYGGEEFAVLLPGLDRAAAQAIAERIRARIERTVIALSPSQKVGIRVSAGLSTAPDDGLDRLALMRLADEGLYRAKADGRNRVDDREGLMGAAAIKLRLPA